jgi:hypothetical protein
LLGHAQHLTNLLCGAFELGGDLRGGGLATELLDEGTLGVDDLVELIHHVAYVENL